MDCNPPGSSAHGIFQARILDWVAIFFPREPSWPRDWTQVSCIGRQILYCLSYKGSPQRDSAVIKAILKAGASWELPSSLPILPPCIRHMIFFLGLVVCGTLVPQSGIEPGPHKSPNYWMPGISWHMCFYNWDWTGLELVSSHSSLFGGGPRAPAFHPDLCKLKVWIPKWQEQRPWDAGSTDPGCLRPHRLVLGILSRAFSHGWSEGWKTRLSLVLVRVNI